MKALIILIIFIFLFSACLQEPININTPDEDLYIHASDLYSAGKFDSSKSLLLQLIHDYPSSLKLDNAQLKLGLCYRALKKVDSAVLVYRNVESKSNGYEESVFRIGDAMYEDMSVYPFDSAITAYRFYLEQYPKGSWADDAYYSIGQSFYKMESSDTLPRIQMYDSALVYYDSLRTLFIDSSLSSSALYRISWTLYQKNFFQASADSFSTFLVQYPEDLSADGALYWQAKSYLNLKDPCSALPLLQQFVDEYSVSDKISDVRTLLRTTFCNTL